MVDFEADTPAPQPTDESADAYYSKISPGIGAAIGSQVEDSATAALYRASQRGQFADASPLDRALGRNISDEADPAAQYGDPAYTPQIGQGPAKGPLLPADEVNKRFAPQGPDGKQASITDRPMSEGLAILIAKQKQDEMDRNAVWARYAGSHNILTTLGVGTAGFMLDPINIGSMFIPGVGEEAILARLGTGALARTGARFGAGLTTGGVQQGALSALKYGLGQEEASDYDLRAAFKDMAFGAAFGAVTHAGFGGLREAGVLKPDALMTGHGDVGTSAPLAPGPEVPPDDLAAVENATLDQRQTAMRAATSQIVEGREVDVSPIIRTGEARGGLEIPPGISDDLVKRARVLAEDGTGVPPSRALEEAAIQRAPKDIQDALFGEPAQNSGGDAAHQGGGSGPAGGDAGQPSGAGERLRSVGADGGSGAGSAVGSAASRVFYGSRSIDVRHELAEASGLVTSHDANFATNPSFPSELQPRDRGAIPARAQVNGIAANLQPERLGPSPEANSGAPIVGPDNVVESGNGRTMAIRQAYASGGDRAAAYRDFLRRLGHDTTGFREPVLVARRLTELSPDERAAFAHATASSEAQRLGMTETALSDARAITPDVSQFLQPDDVASAANRDFVKAFVAKMPAGEAAGMMAANGSLSAAGVARLRAAVTARAYGDENVIARAFESRDSNIKSVATALTDSAADWIKMREAVDRGEIAASDDVTLQVMQTVQTIMRARDEGERMSDVFRQDDMFADALPRQVTRFFFKGDDYAKFYSASAIGDNLSTYARDLVEGALKGADMFGNAPPGARDVLGGLIDRNRALGDTMGESAPLLTASDLAQQQRQIRVDGFAPGTPQAEFDAVNERLYGPKADGTAARGSAEGGPAADPGMEALEQRVTSSPHLTNEDRSILAEANEAIRYAARQADAYAAAGEMLARGEAVNDAAVLPSIVAKAISEASDASLEQRPFIFDPEPDAREIQNTKTGEKVTAQDVRPFSEMLSTDGLPRATPDDKLTTASALAIGQILKNRIGDLKVFTVNAAQMRALTKGRMRDINEGMEAAGFYDPSHHAIVVLDSAMKDPAERARLMVHEGLHASFMRVIEDSPSAREVIDHIRGLAAASHFERGGEAADHYGLSNAHEFVSEAFSNPEFQRFLSEIEAPTYLVKSFGLDQPGLIRTMWDAFTHAVRTILGIPPGAHTLLDASMRLGKLLDDLPRDGEGRATGTGIAPKLIPGDEQNRPISRIEAQVAQRGGLGPSAARTLIREVADRAEKMRLTGVADPYVAAARDLADKIQENARKDKLDALRNAESRTAVMARIEAAGGMAAAPEQLRSMLHGTYKSGLDSVQSKYRGLASAWQAALSHKLHSLGIEKAVISGAMDEDIAKDLWSMNAGGGEGSGNKLARQAAEAIRPVLDEIKNRLNGLGARIGDATDYVTTTRHDPYKMRRAAGTSRATPDEAFQAWWKDTQPLLADKTFDDIVPRDGETPAAARDRFGRSVYDALITGIHMTPEGASGVKFDPNGEARSGPAFEGTRNLAKKVSQDRTLFWKGGAEWNSYVQKYGAQTSLTEGVMRTVNQASKQIALMERFGTNPMANLNQIERAVAEDGRADFEGLKKFQSKMNGVRNVMAYLDGSAGIPANADWAQIGNNIRTAYSIFDLGGVGITHFASIWPTVSSEFRHHGVGRLEGLASMAGGLLKGRGSAERQEILSDIGAYADGLTRDMQANWQPDSPQMGRMSSMANTFMKYTGIHYVFDNTQAAVRSMLSHNLARNMSKEFGAIEPHLRNMLTSYGIKEREWNLLRSVGDLKTENGRAYFTPKDAMRVDPALAEQHLRDTGAIADPPQGELDLPRDPNEAVTDPVEAAREKLGQSLADKIGGYLSDSAAHSTVTAGARERALLLGGTKAGSASGEVMRFLTQFKMWPVAAYDQLLRREIYMRTSAADAAWGLGAIVALSTASGYFRMSVNDLALGKPLRNPMDWKTALGALAQGGGLGIMGDFLFGEVNRMGGGLIATAGGPLVSDADELIKIFDRFRNDLTDPASHHRSGTFADLWPDLARFGVHHIPFGNLVYLKGTLDYLLWYHLYEAASPGWWDRTNRRMLKEQGRTMQGYQPGGGVPVGVPYLYMKNNSGQSFGFMGK